MKFLVKIKRALYGDLSGEELTRFLMLALTLLFIIGTYWLMRPLKDTIFTGTVGKAYLPWAKIVSLCCVLPVVLGYAKLVDLFPKQKLFYILCCFYSVVFLVIAYFLNHPHYGLANKVYDKSRLIGWVSYVAVETFGSLVISLFWSFVASNINIKSAKKGYGLIIFGAQIGSMTGPLIAVFGAKSLGIPFLALIVSFSLLLIPLLVKWFIITFPEAAETSQSFTAKKKTSPWEGLRLIATRKYLMGVLAISTLYEVVATYLDMNFKMLARGVYTTNGDYGQYLGYFGFVTNATTFVLALVGTSFAIRRFGLTACLVLYPILASGLVLVCSVFSTTLTVFFLALVLMKALSYSLNNPCKEIMYIPTSKDVKFKAKNAIDMFGGRFAKATGSGVALLALNAFILGPIISFSTIAIWIFSALYVGRSNAVLSESGKIVE